MFRVIVVAGKICSENHIEDASEESNNQLLIENKADISAGNHYALRWASQHGHFSTVQFLIENKADISAQNHFGLRWASRNGHTSTVQLLINNKANISALQ